MKAVTFTDALPALAQISTKLDKLRKIEVMAERKSILLAAALRDVRVGIKSELAGLINRMDDPNRQT